MKVKPYYFIPVTIFLLSFLPPRKPENEREKMNLRGNVKSVYEECFSAVLVNNELKKDSKNRPGTGAGSGYDSYHVFDKRGYLLEYVLFYSSGIGYPTKLEWKINAAGFTTECTDYDSKGFFEDRTCWLLDGKGKVLEEKIYKERKNKLAETTVCAYDDHGNMIRSEKTGGKKPGTIEWNYVYDQHGNILEEIRTQKDIFPQISSYRYDDQNHKIYHRIIRSGGKYIFKKTWKYDAAGTLIEEISYNEKDTLKIRETTRYNTSGQKTRTIYDEAGNFDSEFVYAYDNMKRVSELLVYSEKDLLDRRELYKYDEKGNLTEEVKCDYSDSSLRTHFYSYDKYGNKLEYRSEDRNFYTGTLHYSWKETYEFTYDEQGNWTRQVIYKNDTPEFILERTIIYY